MSLADLQPETWLDQLTLSAVTPPDWALNMLCRAVYDPRRDDADFRRTLQGSETQRRSAFDALRKHYPPRREIDGLKVAINGESEALQQVIDALGATRL